MSIAPAILEKVGDPGRPRANVPPSRDLGHLPGESGALVGARNLIAFLRRGNRFLVEQSRRFGPVHRSQFGPMPIVFVSDPDLLVRIFKNEDKVWSAALGWRTFFEGLNPHSPYIDSLGALDFEPHRDARKLLQPAFSAAATEGYLDLAQPMFERAIDGWTRDRRVAMKPTVRRLLANTSSRMFMGLEDPREARMLDRALSDVWGSAQAMVRNRFISRKWRRGMRGYATLRRAFTPRIAERRARGGADLFSRLCAESRGASWLDDDGLVRLYIGVMAGAFDTTASGLASTVYLLARHPEWQERLREEARAVAPGRLPYADVKRLVKTDWVWKEALRLFPIAPDVPRRALRDVDLGGWRIPAGAMVLAMLGSLYEDPKWWTDPRRFDPERFSEARAEDRRHKGLFLPFGSGAHACIGMHLAGVEALAFLHALVTRCRFRLAHDYEAHHTFTPIGIVSGQVDLAVESL